MSDLSPRASDLVRAGRSAMRPSAADRARVSTALRARLGDAALPLEVAGSVSLFAKVAWAKVAAVSAAVGVVAAGAVFALHESPAPSRGPLHELDRVQAAEVRERAVTPAPAANVDSAGSGAVSAKVAPESSSANSVGARRPADRLAEEVAILSRATSELHAGRAANALKAVDEHQRKFPRGLLSEERRAARAQALCALGRLAEAEPELARLGRTAPQSPNTLRAKQICSARARAQ